MRKAILYGILLAGMVFLLKVIEYKFLVRDLSIEIYIGIIAVMFTVLGIWGGRKLTRVKEVMVEVPVPNFVLNEKELNQLGISKRELEVLQLMASGLSNQEIADRLFVSLNTIKTHTSNLFVKLDVKRRTQAIQKAKSLSLIS
jgi:two-component system, NarL family, response regulator LiaR